MIQMAVVGNSYLYHMRKDLVEHIETGVAQVSLLFVVGMPI